MKKGIRRILPVLLLVWLFVFSGCEIPEDMRPYLNYQFTDYIQMKDGVLWGIPCAYSRISSNFGYRTHPTTGEWKLHKGIDLAAPKGTPIYASRSGVVVFAGWADDGSGNYVSIDHQDGYKTQYLHMSEVVAKDEQEVKMGDLIGYVGSTGVSTGPHLHFVIRKWNEEKETWDWVDPNDYIVFPEGLRDSKK